MKRFKGIVFILMTLCLIAGCDKKDSDDKEKPDKKERKESQKKMNKCQDKESGLKTINLTSYSYNLIYEDPELKSDDFFYGDGSYKASGNLILPVNINGTDINLLRDSLISMAGVYFLGDNKIRPRMEGYRLTDRNPGQADPSMESVNNLTVTLINPEVIVWENYVYDYLGGAHGMYGTRYLNYSLKSDKILSLDDLFKSGYTNILTKIIRNHLQERKDELLVSINDVEIPSVFQITNNGIQFVYSPYEIAPFSSGEIRIDIYLWELEENNLLRPGIKESVFGDVD